MKKVRKKFLAVMLMLGIVVCQMQLSGVTAKAAETISSVTINISGSGSTAEVSAPTGANYTILSTIEDENGTVYALGSINANTGYEFSANDDDEVKAMITVNGGSLDGASYSNRASTPKTIILFSIALTGGSGSSGGSSSGSSDSSSGSSSSSSGVSSYHNHAENGNTDGFVWDVVSEASETSDGVEVFRCPDCGYVLYRIPVSGYSVFNKNAVTKISKAPQGGTVTLDTDRWISFHKMVIDAMKQRPDVNININYTLNNTGYTLSLPAGTDYSAISADDTFVGFLYLAKQTGKTAAVR